MAAVRFLLPALALGVTVRNDVPRLDDQGRVVDAHSGLIVQHNGTYFWYGERYGNVTGMDWQWSGVAPKLGLYTSTDFETWTDRGLILPPSNGTQWVPHVFYEEKSERFVAWFGEGNWGTAVSTDGVTFEYAGEQHKTSRLGGSTDGNNVFVDDDGVGYIIFSASGQGHRVSIERLAPDLLSSTKINVTGFFPDSFVECPLLFKRKDIYYVTYGTCCCACREGSGLVVFTAPDITGPWTRQTPPYSDVNCRNESAPICPGSAFRPEPNPIQNPTIPAQGYTISQIRTRDGNTQFVWMGNRWLQGPGNNPECTNLCTRPAPEACTTEQPLYRVGRDPVYMSPLQFDDAGRILPLQWQDSFELDV